MIYVATRDFFGAVQSLVKVMFNKEVDLVPSTTQIPDDMELLIFTGGQDINPEIYGEENIYSYYSNGRRDTVELALLDLVIPYDIPVFGICRGHQLISAYFGGKLHQDLDMVGIGHDGQHNLVMENDTFSVNSMHHQGVYIPALGQKVIGWHKEVSELTLGENYPYVTTQFHPEFGCTVEVFNLIKELITGIL